MKNFELKKIFLLCFAVFAVYFNSLNNDFMFDDKGLTINNPVVVSASLKNAFFSYRPIRTISYIFDYRVFGKKPFGFRLMNIFYHSIVVVLVFLFLQQLGLSSFASFFSALIFAIHPVQTDSVSYISGRRDILVALFYILSLIFFIKFYKEKFKNKKIVFFVLAFVFMILSFFSKQTGATIPLVWLLILVYFEGFKVFKAIWFRVLTLVFVILFLFFALYTIQTKGSDLVTLHSIQFFGNSAKTHYLTALTIFIFYIKQLFFPLQLFLDNANYSLSTGFSSKVIFSILGIFSFFGIVFFLIKKSLNNLNSIYWKTAFFMLFFLVSMAPVLQIIPLHEIVANHYLYLPLLGFSGILGMVFEKMFFSLKKQLNFANFFIILLLFFMFSFFIYKTISRNFELKNIWTALKADEVYKPLSFRGLFTIGANYMDMKFPDKAYEYYEKALKTNNYDGVLYANIIGYYLVKGDFDDALRFYNWTKSQNRYVLDSGRLYVAIIYTIRGECNKAVNIVNYIRKLPSFKKRIEFVENCRTYNFGHEKTVEDFLKTSKRLKKLGFNVERKIFLKKLIKSGYFKGEELIKLVDELAKINFISDIPEALKYYEMEKTLLKKERKQIPSILNKTILVLRDYKEKVLVKQKYFKIDF